MSTLALRTGDRRHAMAHAVRLSGLRSSAAERNRAPLIVERRDQDFVAGLLADLSEPGSRAALPASAPQRHGGVPRLLQPVQRVFNLLVLEAWCDEPGQPRVNPESIESAGIVVRRLAGNTKQAWLKAGTRSFGWESVDEDLDPECDRRAPAVSLGAPVLNEKAPSQQRVRTAGSARLAASKRPVNEEIVPLFVVPPKVCAAAGKTLLFGHLPVIADEMTESEPEAPAYGADADERGRLQGHLLSYLKAAPATPLPLGGLSFSTEDARKAAQNQGGALSRAQYDSLDKLMLFLQQLQHEFDAFADSAPARALMALLAKIDVETDAVETVSGIARTVTVKRPAGDFLGEAKAVLMDAQPGARLAMPHRWGVVSAALADQIFAATLDCLKEQYKRVKPASGRFEATGAAEERYVARAFIRLRPEVEGCPPRLLWSDYTEPYTIAPWWESSGAPVPLIPMPDLFDRDALARIKPNVAFALPPKLANLLRADPKKLRDGEGSGEGFELGWICSFSIPIISLCAFIILNIFLQLFALIFFWLPFLKICIPFPKKK
jgi:hypothetical protein